tara:strand:- start:774 stop:1004 length:231 start_codon:yes stop_codon:yes gene_type:complete
MKPIEHARAILGEHMTHYVILAVAPDAPMTLQMRTDDRYAANGLLSRGIDILSENVVDEGWEIQWTDEDEDEDNEI